MPDRKELPTWLFALIVIIEFYTANVIIFKTLLSNSNSYDLLSIISGPPRYIVSILASWKLAGPEIWRYHILIDNLTALGILSILCYFFLIVGREGSNALDAIALVNYMFLVLFYNGHFRIFLKVMKWSSQRVIVYKLNKIYFVSLYVGLAAYNTIHVDLGDLREIYLLFVLTSAAYYSEFIFAISGEDGTDRYGWEYQIGENDEHHGHGHGHGHGQTGHDAANQSSVELSIAQ